MSREFHETRKLFANYIGYTDPLTYQEWMVVPEEKKIAYLFCQFFNEIELAWYKSKSFYACEQEGVETVIQYLHKNIPRIMDKPSRFSSPYIYRVAYNCLYCISHDRKCDRDRYEKESSNIVVTDGRELNIYDFIRGSEFDMEFDDRVLQAWFWKTIEDCGSDALMTAARLMDGGRRTKGITPTKEQELIEKLQEVLAKFKPYYYI